MIRQDRCPSCSSPDIRLLFPVKDHSVSGEVFDIAACSSCGFRFTRDIPGPEAIGAYYRSEEYVSHTDSRKGLVNRLYHLVRRFTLSSKRRLVVRLSGKHRGRLLDYGCGTGAFLACMKASGWDVSGLEPDETARQNAHRLHALSVGRPEELSALPSGAFDAVTLWHVLEHVHGLHPTLAELRRVLAPGGLLLIAVPNHLSADALHYGPHWAAWDVPRHLHHFSPAPMRALLSSEGLTVTDILPMWFDSFYVSLLSERYRHGGLRPLQAFFRGLASNLAALGDRERCSSVIYVARASSPAAR